MNIFAADVHYFASRMGAVYSD